MRLAVDHYESNAEGIQPELPFLSALVRTVVVRAIRWLIELATLTETDQLEAGIFLGGEGRDR